MQHVFKSQKDAFFRYLYWIWLLPATVWLVCFLVFIITGNENTPRLYIFLIFISVYTAYSLSVWYGLNYKIEPSGHISICLFNIRIRKISISDISSITHIRKGSYIWGLSFSTITLLTRTKDEINISPQDRAVLITMLTNLNDSIEVSEKLKEEVQK